MCADPYRQAPAACNHRPERSAESAGKTGRKKIIRLAQCSQRVITGYAGRGLADRPDIARKLEIVRFRLSLSLSVLSHPERLGRIEISGGSRQADILQAPIAECTWVLAGECFLSRNPVQEPTGVRHHLAHGHLPCR